MSWIILALTLGASITSIIHGVFMLFGSLSVGSAAIPGIPSTMLAVLPIVSAVFALIGGIIAFNQSKWGAIFLLIATALCIPARDTWLYGGLYFFAALLCFFLKPKSLNDYDYADYDDDIEDSDNPYGNDNDDDSPDFYYEQDIIPEQPRFSSQLPRTGTLDDDIAPAVNNEPPKVRRRTTKTCPSCGAIVSRESHVCPQCGEKLFVFSSESIDNTPPDDIDQQATLSLDDQLLMPKVNVEQEQPVESVQLLQEQQEQPEGFYDDEYNNNYDGDDDMSSAQAVAPNYKVQIPRRNMQSGRVDLDEAASSYQEFSKYTRRSKKRKRSAGRKVLSIMLLIAAVGGALYFLLGLRKLPPGDLPPMVRPEVIQVTDRRSQENTEANSRPVPSIEETIAQPVEIAVAENMLPNFTPDRMPTSGTITGNGVNVRADHTTSATRITRLNGGTRIDIIGQFNVPSGQYSGIWYNIRTGGRDGWVYGRYVQPLGSGIPTGYSNALLKSFGSTKSQLVENLGQPTRNTSSSAEWPGLTATLRGEDITRLRLSSSNRELQNGLKTGMSQTALLQILGYPSSVSNRTWNYNEGTKTGVSIQLGTNNVISNITVNEIQ